MAEAHAAERDIASTPSRRRRFVCTYADTPRQARQRCAVAMRDKWQSIQGWLAHNRFGQAMATVARSRLRDEDKTVGIETCALRLGEQSFVVWDCLPAYLRTQAQSLEPSPCVYAVPDAASGPMHRCS
jgi:hypothetical protein